MILTNPKIYNLRIVPPEPVFTDVTGFKKTFITHFGKQPLSASKPHITLAVFEMRPQYQDTLIKSFNALSNLQEFRLDVSNFDTFSGSKAKVLLLKVPITDALKQLHTQIKILWERDLHRKKTSLIVPDIPHMTISKAKDTAMLYKALELFRSIPYYNNFLVTNLVLIARDPGRTWDWEYRINLKCE
ncbi:2'-5' RNA ligase family protein [Snuella lapsa]|uniref:2'-5' RNA ligase n=1 Tax=Snuella lapsa TaxID=870481 RepID=A0ABP6YFW9_9FLAO